jgi:bifunctional non-homologous end joining protein LigD
MAESNRFVVHEHWATSHHFDLRLERNGVLESWAVPRGMPGPGGANRLAIRVEDHDLDHIDFTDDTPVAGRPDGAVRKSIWDAGTYELIRSDDDKLVFDLHGETLDGRFALIHTGGRNWLILRME